MLESSMNLCRHIVVEAFRREVVAWCLLRSMCARKKGSAGIRRPYAECQLFKQRHVLGGRAVAK